MLCIWTLTILVSGTKGKTHTSVQFEMTMYVVLENDFVKEDEFLLPFATQVWRLLNMMNSFSVSSYCSILLLYQRSTAEPFRNRQVLVKKASFPAATGGILRRALRRASLDRKNLVGRIRIILRHCIQSCM